MKSHTPSWLLPPPQAWNYFQSQKTSWCTRHSCSWSCWPKSLSNNPTYLWYSNNPPPITSLSTHHYSCPFQTPSWMSSPLFRLHFLSKLHGPYKIWLCTIAVAPPSPQMCHRSSKNDFTISNTPCSSTLNSCCPPSSKIFFSLPERSKRRMFSQNLLQINLTYILGFLRTMINNNYHTNRNVEGW